MKNDLVYFVHGKHAGLSAFISADVEGDGDENRELRGARQISVGVLVPGQGRLGRAWLHAEGVRGLASFVSPPFTQNQY